MRVLFDMTSTPVLGTVLVQGELVFEDSGARALDAQEIIVEGSFAVGSCECPFQNEAVITLHTPSDQNRDNFGVGTKVLGVLAGGTLDLHGSQDFGPSWTTLEVTAAQGASTLQLSESVGWQVGDTIALASSDFDWRRYEVFSISAVAGNSVTINGTLQWQHFAAVTAEGVDERNQVARLTRNVRVRGNPADTAANDNGVRFGGHMMFLAGQEGVRLSNIEVGPNMGQSGRLGRYPVHFHLAGDAANSYVQDLAIHDNFQRCLVLHGTQNMVVERTVGFRTFGHCFFLEDGVETGNRLAFNLGFANEQVADSDPLQILPSDDEPATFWTTHPANTLVHNVAAGSPAFGFWYALPLGPLGPSDTTANEQVVPARTPLGTFSHNIAHSNGRDGLFVDRGPDQLTLQPNGGAYDPVASPVPQPDPSSPGQNLPDQPVEAVFDSLTSYKNRNRGAWLRGGLLRVQNSYFADNAIGITLAINRWEGLVVDCVFVGETANTGSPPNFETVHSVSGRSLPFPWDPVFHIRGFEFYDGPVSIRNSRFFAFVPDAQRGSSALSMLRNDEFSIAPTNDAAALSFSPEIVRRVEFPDFTHDGDRDSLFLDLDGSVTGRPPTATRRAVVVNRDPFYATSSCVLDAASQNTVRVCPDHFAYLAVNARNPGLLSTNTVQLFRDDLPGTPRSICGGACPPVATTERTSFRSSLIENHGYTLHIPAVSGNAFPSDIELLVLYTSQAAVGGGFAEYRIGVCLPAGATVLTTQYGFHNSPTPAASLAALNSNPITLDPFSQRGNGLWFHDTTANYLYVRLVAYEERDPADRAAFPAAQFRFTLNTAGLGAPSCTPNNIAGSGDPGIPPLAPAPGAGPFGPAMSEQERGMIDCTLNQPSSASQMQPQVLAVALLWAFVFLFF